MGKSGLIVYSTAVLKCYVGRSVSWDENKKCTVHYEISKIKAGTMWKKTWNEKTKQILQIHIKYLLFNIA